MSVLDPLAHALATLVAAVHTALAWLGLNPASGMAWLLCIAAVVVTVRISLLPLAAHGVRLVHASARARPQLQDLAERYRGRHDPDAMRALIRERRRIAAEHGMSRLGCLPLLVQVPIWLSLYLLLSEVAAGSSPPSAGPRCWAYGWPSVATSPPGHRTWRWLPGWRGRLPSCPTSPRSTLFCPTPCPLRRRTR
jgi:YidC/Oxa1 family membrane protein insertase